MAPTDTHVLLVAALELQPEAPGPRAALTQQEAGALCERLAHDLALIAPAVTALDLSVMAAHFDTAEVLRAGWPIHRRLEELHARAPRGGAQARLMAFGADADGVVPQPLQADAHLQGGPMRVLPLLLSGPAEKIAAVGELLENELLDRGMARAETALLAQELFATRIEHMRLLTLHDLLAMTAMQYAHMGLEPLWPLIETALLAPGEPYELDAPPEPHVCLSAEGEATISLLSGPAWGARHAPGEHDPDRLQKRMAQVEARQRQFAAVLQAHGIDVVYAYEAV